MLFEIRRAAAAVGAALRVELGYETHVDTYPAGPPLQVVAVTDVPSPAEPPSWS
jgi:hypothetical protein